MKKISFKESPGYLLMLAVVFLVLPQFVRLGNPFLMHILLIFIFYSILAVSLNLTLGYAGQPNLAHATFFGIGGYTSALLVMRLGIDYWLALLLGGVAAAIMGFVVGYPSLRLRGVYFALVTLAFSHLMTMVFTNWVDVTGGEFGLYGIPEPTIMGRVLSSADRLTWVYIAVGFLLLTIFVVDRVTNSRIGNALIAIREDEDLAKSTGINTMHYKLLAVTLSSFFAGIAGGLYGAYMGVITPGDFDTMRSLLLLGMCVLGGMGTMLGPIFGCMITQLVPEVLRPIAAYYYLVFGVVICVVILRAPSGIMGVIRLIEAWLVTRGAKSRREVQI